jgi:hypothetical protein
MSYPGNSTLGKETQQRLLKTFEQTLDLAQRGSAQEALLGCDFILRMDPQFEPARTLLARLNATTGPIDISDLRSSSSGQSAAPPTRPPAPQIAPAPPPPRAQDQELSFADLEDFGSTDLSARMQAPATAAAPAPVDTTAATHRHVASLT